MLSVLFWCFCFVSVHGDLREMSLPVYTPPSEEEMRNAYFRKPEECEANRTKKSIINDSDNFQKAVEVMKKDLSENINILQKGLIEKNTTEGNSSQPFQIRTGIVKNFFMGMIEPTTYRYPTAVWSSQIYEKFKNSQRFRSRNATKVYVGRPTLNPAYVYLDRGYKTHRRNRGKTKWKDLSKSSELDTQDVNSELADRFLEQSLDKYLTSSNLRENVGNVSVKTFSDILRNITEQKPKRLPYDENKELRMKFREEVILKKKNETKPQGGFLEKQLQRRLEKVQDVYNEKDKDKILANMWRYATLNRTTDPLEEKSSKNAAEEAATKAMAESFAAFTTPHLLNMSLMYITTDNPGRYSTGHIRGTAKYHRPTYETTEKARNDYEGPEEGRDGGANANLLTAEETTYYRRGQFPRLTFIGQPGGDVMPTFELVVLYRQMNNPALKSALKRSAGYLFEFGATIRKMTNLGFRDMPYYIKRKGTKHRVAHHFVFDFDSGMDVPKPLREKLMLDLDVVRATTVMCAHSPVDLHFPNQEPECTKHLDLLPPPYREKIIKLQKEAEEKAKKKHTHKNYEDKQFLIF